MPTAFIVEDIEIARKSLIKQLTDAFCDLEIIGEADGVLSALKQINKLKPQFLFLDINLPDGDAFDILDCIDYQDYRIIFTTASDQYAIKAFQVAAIDYLLKPIDKSLLNAAVEKAYAHLATTPEQISLAKSNLKTVEYPDKIAISNTEKIAIVLIKSIIRCQASSNYTIFYFADGTKEIVAKTLKDYEKILDPSSFIRTHQSHLVNLDYVKEFVKKDGGYLLLHNDEIVPVSVRKRPSVIERLK